jgi:uncharacterized membrane protein
MKILAVKTTIAFLCVSGLTVATGVQYRFKSAGEFPGAFQTVPLADNLQKIVGYYESSSTVAGYLEGPSPISPDKHTFSAVAPPGSGTSYAAGINNNGVVVGGFCAPPGCNPQAADHGFTYNQGIYSTIDYPQTGATTAAYGINDLGEIVGGYCAGPSACPVGATALTTHGFLDNHGAFTQLDFPESQYTQADAINNAGVIVGAYDINNTGPHGDLHPSIRKEVCMIQRKEGDGYVEREAQRSADDWGVEATGGGTDGGGCRS